MAIYLVFSHIEQTTPDDYCAKYGSEHFFYQFESHIADAILRFKVIKMQLLFSILFQMGILLLQKKRHYNNLWRYIFNV